MRRIRSLHESILSGRRSGRCQYSRHVACHFATTFITSSFSQLMHSHQSEMTFVLRNIAHCPFDIDCQLSHSVLGTKQTAVTLPILPILATIMRRSLYIITKRHWCELRSTSVMPSRKFYIIMFCLLSHASSVCQKAPSRTRAYVSGSSSSTTAWHPCAEKPGGRRQSAFFPTVAIHASPLQRA